MQTQFTFGFGNVSVGGCLFLITSWTVGFSHRQTFVFILLFCLLMPKSVVDADYFVKVNEKSQKSVVIEVFVCCV